MTPPPIPATADTERASRLEADRVTANWRNRSERHPADLTWSPLFAGEAVPAGARAVERQHDLFSTQEETAL